MKRPTLHRNFLLLAILTLAVAMSPAQAQIYADLFEFDGANHGCCSAYPAMLAQGRDGNLYGTALTGGSSGHGTIFKVTTSGALATLFSFDFTHGSGPQGGLSMGLDGNFYGTTYQGGVNSLGTIFQITPTGTFTLLYSFSNTTDGAYPRTPPVPAPDGNLYGATGNGTVPTAYKITPSGTFTKLATLPAQSYAPMTLGVDGKLYGTTLYGGTFNRGTAFSMTTKGVVKIIHSFDDPTGALPYSRLLQASDGSFYGTASIGGTSSGGVVFKLTPSGTYTVLFNFSTSASANGFNSFAGLVQGSDGFLYGVTQNGGANNFGGIFKIKTNGASFAVVHSFDKTQGSAPNSTPILHTNGKIYGLTQGGGATNQGVFYSLDASLKPFATDFVIWSGKVGTSIEVLGQGFSSASGVLFGSGPGTFLVSSDTYMTATVAAGGTTGAVTIQEPSGNLVSPQKFKVIPSITGFSPTSGTRGTTVVITGMSLKQATAVKFGAALAKPFTVNSDTQITTTVPAAAVTGPVKISITTPGGIATSTTTFTVN